MAYEWTEDFIGVIPIGLRDDMAAIATRIMPDVDEDKMFDSIRLSSSGKEPATHLATVCAMQKDMADKWRQILLPSSSRPRDYPTTTTRATDKTTGSISMVDLKATAIITDRIENFRVKASKTVKLIDSRRNIETVSDINDVFTALGLVQIPQTDR